MPRRPEGFQARSTSNGGINLGLEERRRVTRQTRRKARRPTRKHSTACVRTARDKC